MRQNVSGVRASSLALANVPRYLRKCFRDVARSAFPALKQKTGNAWMNATSGVMMRFTL
jgi:hypothetical protein